MYKFQVYKDTKGEWRWRFEYNSKIMADSGEGYAKKRNAKRALRWLAVKMFFARKTEIL